MRSTLRSLVVLLLSVGVPAMAQDLTIVSKVMRDGGPPTTSISYISSDRARMSHGGDGKESIVDYTAGQITTVDTAKQTYYVTTRQDLDAMGARMKEQMNGGEGKKAQEAMKNLSPEQQKKMDDMMGSMFTFDVQKTGTTRRIAGYTCENWKVTMGKFSNSEECLTNELQFPTHAWEMYKGFADSMQGMMGSMGPMAKNAAKMQEQFKQMKGYPLAKTTTVDVMGHKSVVTIEVTEIKRGPIPASVWEIPAGFTKVDNPMLRSMQSHSRPRS
jgi:hypothetical protein